MTLSKIKIARNPHHFKKLSKAHRCSRDGLKGEVEETAIKPPSNDACRLESNWPAETLILYTSNPSK